MIKKFVNKWNKSLAKTEEHFSKNHPANYDDIVKQVINILYDKNEIGVPDPERITVIDYGEYQGTMVYIISENGYRPRKYWHVKMEYGSCDMCDTLSSIRGSSYNKLPTQEQKEAYMALCLHVVQRLKEF